MPPFRRFARRAGLFPLIVPVVAMAVVVLTSNILVALPVRGVVGGVDLSQFLTWGAFSYPAAFLVTDVANRLFGAAGARKVAYAGFVFGLLLSLLFAQPRIAAASGAAFLTAQLLDIHVFDRLRAQSWWKAPLFSSLFASALDTALFFSLAFAGTGLPWSGWALGDFAAKLLMMAALLYPYKWLVIICAPSPRPS